MTVSKTTYQKAQEWLSETRQGEDLTTLAEYLADFADSLTAELQKENARLAKSLTDVRECPQCGALCEIHAELSFEALSGKSLENVAGLEKENARLREALENLAGVMGRVEIYTNSRQSAEIDSALIAAGSALSKEKE